MSRWKRLTLSAIAAVSLCVLLAGVGYALGYIFYEVKDNYFHTGTVDVEIAYEAAAPGEISLFTPGVLYEPGMTLQGDFTVTNRSTDEEGIWCRLYFTDVSGPLADVLEASIYDGETLICSGSVRDWENRRFMEEPLALAHKGAKTLTLELHYPESAGNETQASSMAFALAVVAVQRSNNPGGLFS